jgi:formiminoglutamase
MPLPILLSVPHAGLKIPNEVADLCILQEEDIIKDGDEGADEIYLPMESEVGAMVNTVVARAIVDMNRSENDIRKDGVIKTHTCWNVPIYSKAPSQEVVQTLIERYYRSYHADLSRLSVSAKLGIDCHTMAEYGPPVGPDPGRKRPRICLSNGDLTCSKGWIDSLASCFADIFQTEVSINNPFKGGHIIRSHAKEMPWIQLELSRERFLSNNEKSDRVLKALKMWFKRLP